MKMQEPQFSGQTKERLSSREAAAFVSGVVKDAFSLWLNEHAEIGLQLAELAISNAGRRLKAARRSSARRSQGRRCPANWPTAPDRNRCARNCSWSRATPPAARRSRRGTRNSRRPPLRGKILNTWEVDGGEVLASQEVHDIAVAIGVDPGASDLAQLRYGKICILADADSDGLHIATLLCALFVRHFRPLVEAGHVYVAMPPLYRIDLGKDIYYALDEAERDGILERLAAEEARQAAGHPLQGPWRNESVATARDHHGSNTRRLVQLTLEDATGTLEIMDMLLAKKRAGDRKSWLESKGNLAEVLV